MILLATDKSRYFAQSSPIIVYCFTKYTSRRELVRNKMYLLSGLARVSVIGFAVILWSICVTHNKRHKQHMTQKERNFQN